jgi:hypothetical protein
LSAGNGGGLRVDDFDLEIGGGCCRKSDENQKRGAKCAHNHPPFHAKGVKVDGLRRSPGFASEDARAAIGSWQLAIGSGTRDLQAAFPGWLPVDGCDVLAYSCAAARELHPLPCLRHKAKTRKPKDISKNKIVEREIYRAKL